MPVAQMHAWFDELDARTQIDWFDALDDEIVSADLVDTVPVAQRREGKTLEVAAFAYWVYLRDDVAAVFWRMTPEFRAFLEGRRDQHEG